MARAEIDLVVNKVSATTARVSAGIGATVNVYVRNADGTNGAAATVYTTPNLGTTAANPITSDAAGRIAGWLDQGSYNLVVSGTGITTYTQPWEAGVVPGAGSIGTTELANNSVTAPKLQSDAAVDANRAVGTDHIQDLAVSTGKIANLGVTTGKLADGSVTLPKTSIKPSCRVHNSGSQTVTASNTLVLVWNFEGHDNDNMHDSVTNNTRITANTQGYYHLMATLEVTNVQAGDTIALRVNGSGSLVRVQAQFSGVVAAAYGASVSDYFEIVYIASATAGTRTFTASVSAFSASLVSTS